MASSPIDLSSFARINQPKQRLIVLVGPTGSGKSALAIGLARRFRGEVLNCDSIQVYRGLDIGSAKVPQSERMGVAHHLIDCVDPGDELTAGGYARLGRFILNEISGRGSLPIVTGGTGFYLRALLDGLSPAPERDEKTRERLRAVAGRRPTALHRFLRRFDPIAAGRIHQNDHQKLIRAIEMTMRGGKPASETQALPRESIWETSNWNYSILKLGLAPNRAALYEHLNRRSAGMFQSGLLEETKGLLNRGISPAAKVLRSLGYKQAVEVLTAQMPLDAAILECQTRTRQYAKRQMTWFRAERDVEWLPGFGSDPAICDEAASLVREFLVLEERFGDGTASSA